MFRFSSKSSGFTLIELLVVITIIGILATGATATFTSQIQKSRDTTRISDIKAMQSAIEQYYQDFAVYPPGDNTQNGITGTGGIIRYASRIPRDPKLWESCVQHSLQSDPADVPCGYVYNVTPDDNNITQGAFEVSTAFENVGNVDSKAFDDDNGWTATPTSAGGTKDDSRLELGVRTTAGIDTQVTVAGTALATGCATSTGVTNAQSWSVTYMPIMPCGN